MPHENSHLPLSSESVAEFLADREGLVGGARERFRRLLHEYGGFRDLSVPARSRIPILVSSFLALGGLALDHPARWSDGLAWVAYALLAAGLIWRLRRGDHHVRHFDRETDWEAYCLFLRPVILSDHPGLLDRNAADHGQNPEKAPLRSLPMLRSLVHERGPEFWWSALLGLWGGLAALIVVRVTVAATSSLGSFVFLSGGVLLGLAVWLLWRRVVFIIAKADAHLTER
jgi:hypothetical protein